MNSKCHTIWNHLLPTLKTPSDQTAPKVLDFITVKSASSFSIISCTFATYELHDLGKINT